MRSLKVLILEDNPFQLMALHQMLNANQVFDVLTADSVDAALHSLENRGAVDVAICDLQMEGQDGLALIGHLAASELAHAVIILSSCEYSVLDGAAQLARQQGVEVLGTLQKPASVAAIGALLNQYIPPKPQPAPITVFMSRPAQVVVDPDKDYSGEWSAHYQPKVDLEGRLVGVEALARWQHPDYGLLMPGQFMPQLEQAGLMSQLTWHMLEQALGLSAQQSHSRGQSLSVAVNIAPLMLADPDFVPRLMALLERFAVKPHMLTLEVVEQSARQLAVVQFENLLRLRLAGCRLSIDDFGTGASNIQRLLELPFSELKIPTEFVRGLADDRRKYAVVAAALFMAQKMALDVVVEGVETIDDYQALSMLGHPVIQGYFIAKPMAQDHLLRWMEDLETNPGRVLPVEAFTPDRAPVSI